MPIRAETRARALALQLLYARDLNDPEGTQTREAAWAGLLRLTASGPAVQEQALRMADAVVQRRDELDGFVQRAAEHWRLERLAAIDRAILRLGVLELLEEVTPPRVVLDESVRLARWFGGGKSPGFVNGVLDRVARGLGRL